MGQIHTYSSKNTGADDEWWPNIPLFPNDSSENNNLIANNILKLPHQLNVNAQA